MPTIKRLKPSYIAPKKDYRTYQSRKYYLKQYQSAQWKQIASEVRYRDNAICQVCNTPNIVGRLGNVDHIMPTTKGGSFSDMSNLWLLCTKCHGIKTTCIDQYGYTGQLNDERLRIPTQADKDRIKEQINQ